MIYVHEERIIRGACTPKDTYKYESNHHRPYSSNVFTERVSSTQISILISHHRRCAHYTLTPKAGSMSIPVHCLQHSLWPTLWPSTAKPYEPFQTMSDQAPKRSFLQRHNRTLYPKLTSPFL